MDKSQSANILFKSLSRKDKMRQPEGRATRAGVNRGPLVCRQRHQPGEWSVRCRRGARKPGCQRGVPCRGRQDRGCKCQGTFLWFWTPHLPVPILRATTFNNSLCFLPQTFKTYISHFFFFFNLDVIIVYTVLLLTLLSVFNSVP